jgi:hypothetical protein
MKIKQTTKQFNDQESGGHHNVRTIVNVLKAKAFDAIMEKIS